MRQIHAVPKLTPKQALVAELVRLQILIARGAPPERLHDAAERAITLLTRRH